MRKNCTKYVAVARISWSDKEADNIQLISAYFKFAIPTVDFINVIKNSLTDGKTLIGADVNGHSRMWHSNDTNLRGRLVEDMIQENHLTVHNLPGHIHTYSRHNMGQSNIDVTLSTPGLSRLIGDWKVVDITDSDHRAITFRLKKKVKIKALVNDTRFCTKRADWEEYRICLANRYANLDGALTVSQRASDYTNALREAAQTAIPRIGNRASRLRPPWWNDDCSSSKAELNRVRRTFDRTSETQKIARRQHLYNIRKAKRQSWRSFSESANTDVWGKAFRWAKKGTQRREPPSTVNKNRVETKTIEEPLEAFMDTFVPADACELDDTPPISECEQRTPVTESEVKDAIWRIGPNKSPGMDGITGTILRKSWPIIREGLVKLYDDCLRIGEFPSPWKNANMVLIPKGQESDPRLTKSYRPISLLPVLAKVLETLIVSRLEEETGLNLITEQHGFTREKSTTTAICELTRWSELCPNKHVLATFLDITGAFDNVRWKSILNKISNMGAKSRTIKMVKSYLVSRTATLKIEETITSRTLTKGCPQGSQLGPTLWKAAMASLAEKTKEKGVKWIFYADDIAILAGASRKETAISKLERAYITANEWASEHGLTFSATKSQTMSIKGGLKPEYTIKLGQDLVKASSPVKYLGVLLDYKLNFWAHVASLADKSADLYTRLRSMMSARWGLSQATARIIYRCVFLPRITYAAPIWEKGLRTKKAITKLGSAQRRALLAVTGAYKTTSTSALQTIAGLLPLDLEIKSTIIKSEYKKGLTTINEYDRKQDDLLAEWERKWSNEKKGEWTKKMIPSVTARMRLPLETDHYTTQLLSGHGDFRGKLHQFKLVDSPNCSCGNGSETVNHVLLSCRNNIVDRNELKAKITRNGDNWPPEDGIFLKNRENYEALRKFARNSLQNKRH